MVFNRGTLQREERAKGATPSQRERRSLFEVLVPPFSLAVQFSLFPPPPLLRRPHPTALCRLFSAFSPLIYYIVQSRVFISSPFSIYRRQQTSAFAKAIELFPCDGIAVDTDICAKFGPIHTPRFPQTQWELWRLIGNRSERTRHSENEANETQCLSPRHRWSVSQAEWGISIAGLWESRIGREMACQSRYNSAYNRGETRT